MDTLHGGVTSNELVQKRKLTKSGENGYSNETGSKRDNRNGVSESDQDRECRTDVKNFHRTSSSSSSSMPLDFSTKKRKLDKGNQKVMSSAEKPSAFHSILTSTTSAPISTSELSNTTPNPFPTNHSIKNDYQRSFDDTLHFFQKNFKTGDLLETNDTGATRNQKPLKNTNCPLLDPLTLYNMSLLFQQNPGNLPNPYSTLSNHLLAQYRQYLLNTQSLKGFDNRSSASSPCLSRCSPKLDKVQNDSESGNLGLDGFNKLPTTNISPSSPHVTSTSHPDIDCGSPLPHDMNGKGSKFVVKKQTSEFYDSDSATMSPSNPKESSSRRRGTSLPDELKDNTYWERRRKNNEAAKKSRDARRAKEDEINSRASTLEQENMRLRVEVAALKLEVDKLKKLLLSH